MAELSMPLIVRGEVIESNDCEFALRDGGGSFTAPNVANYLDKPALRSPLALQDRQNIKFAEILDVLHELGEHLDFERNEHIAALMR